MKQNVFQPEVLFEKGKTIKLSKGGVLHSPLEKCRAIGFVKSGTLRLSRILTSGKEIYINEFKEGEIFAEMLVFSSENYPGWLIASEETTVIELKLNHLLEFLKEDETLISFFKEIYSKISDLTNTIEILSQKTVKQKIAHYLLTQRNQNNQSPVSVTGISKKLGCSREALSRSISELVNRKIIKQTKNSIQIKNRVLLEDLL